MAENQIVDEVVSERAVAGRGRAARAVYEESFDASGTEKPTNRGAEDDSLADGSGGKQGRVFKQSTLDLLAKLDKAPAPHEEGDADEEEEAADDADTAAGDDAGETDGDDVATPDEAVAAGEGDEEGEGKEEEAAAPDPVKEWQTKAQTLEERNRALLSELDTARKTPKAQRSERETTLLAAEAAYIDEGSVPALRKFLSVIVGAAPDSKEVTAELAGLYVDLSAQEVGVPLDQSQQAFRDNARTRLLLARDRREKADGEKKAEPGNDAGEVSYETAAKHLDGLLSTKTQSGTSIADEYPMLMTLAQDFDRFTPSEVLARAIHQEIMTGTLDVNTPDIDMVRAVAPKIEQYYERVGKKITAALAKKNKQPDTTTPSGKPKVKVDAGTETRQGQAARTITTATASRAPAKLPKEAKKAPSTTGEKTRKDFPSEAAWKEHLFDKHFKS